MPITMDDAREGITKQVIYRAPGSEKTETGSITSVGDEYVFVQYEGDKHSKATSHWMLEWADEHNFVSTTGYSVTNLATVSDHGMMIDAPTHCPGGQDPRCKGECTIDGRDGKIMDPDCFR